MYILFELHNCNLGLSLSSIFLDAKIIHVSKVKKSVKQLKLGLGAIHKVRTKVGGGECHDESIQVHTVGGGFKPGEYIRILTVCFPFLKIFSIKNKNHGGSGGFIDVRSE